MMQRAMILVAVILTIALFTLGCRRNSGTTIAGWMNIPAPFSNTMPIDNAQGLEFMCKRTFTDYGSNPPRIYYEEVWLKSNGEYFIECTEIFKYINGIMVPASGPEVMLHNQELEQGTGYFSVFQRGFHIRDPYLFLDNYNYSVISHSEDYLGRDSVRVRILSKYPDRPNYEVWFDKKTALVLKYIEDTVAVDPLTVMEITEIDFTPNFTGIEFKSNAMEKKTVDKNSLMTIGFTVYQPMFVPVGFKSTGLYEIKIGGSPVLRWSYTDGVQEIVIGEYQSPGAPSPQGGLLPEPVMGDIHNVHFSTNAGLRVVIFDLKTTSILIKANLYEEEIATMIESLDQLKF